MNISNELNSRLSKLSAWGGDPGQEDGDDVRDGGEGEEMEGARYRHAAVTRPLGAGGGDRVGGGGDRGFATAPSSSVTTTGARRVPMQQRPEQEEAAGMMRVLGRQASLTAGAASSRAVRAATNASARETAGQRAAASRLKTSLATRKQGQFPRVRNYNDRQD